MALLKIKTCLEPVKFSNISSFGCIPSWTPICNPWNSDLLPTCWSLLEATQKVLLWVTLQNMKAVVVRDTFWSSARSHLCFLSLLVWWIRRKDMRQWTEDFTLIFLFSNYFTAANKTGSERMLTSNFQVLNCLAEIRSLFSHLLSYHCEVIMHSRVWSSASVNRGRS